MATEKSSIFDAASGLTPAGFAANIAADTIATPNTSASGDIASGPVRFGNVNISKGVPTWVILVVAVGAAVLLFRR